MKTWYVKTRIAFGHGKTARNVIESFVVHAPTSEEANRIALESASPGAVVWQNLGSVERCRQVNTEETRS